MTGRSWVVAAGIPAHLGQMFVERVSQTARIVACLPLDDAKSYTDTYSEALYVRMCEKLRGSEGADRKTLLKGARLIFLYLDKGDGREAVLFERFGLESLVTPLRREEILDLSWTTGNQRGRVVNRLVGEARRAISHAGELLDEIALEVTNRDNKTCLLLPPKNFGHDVDVVLDLVRQAASGRMSAADFRSGLKQVSQSLSSMTEGNRRYFVGRGRLVFKSPGKAGSRHGLAPVWDDPEHEPSCVLRGRMRCGASFDPSFHYDCAIPSAHGRAFARCHGAAMRAPRGRSHVNVAPNDNVR